MNFILGKPDEIFKDMGKKSAECREFYSSSLSPLQTDFVLERTKDFPNVKNLIRLVKHWRHTHLLPVSYLLVFLD